MVAFPGGTRQDNSTIGYDFIMNFFSDLGGLSTPSGIPNLSSSILFTIALLVASGCSIPFFIAFPLIFTHSVWSKILSTAGSVLGIVAFISYGGVALSPWDVTGDIHGVFVFLAFITIFIMAILYTVAMFMSQLFQLSYKLMFLAFTLMFGSYVVILYLDSGLVVQTLGQKLVVYGEIVFFSLSAFMARNRFLATNYYPKPLLEDIMVYLKQK